MGMTQKENYLAALRHERYEYVPSFTTDTISAGFGALNGPAFEKGPDGGGYDGFGVRWVAPATGAGAAIPAPGEFLLDSESIVDWKKLVKFPDLAHFDWEEASKRELSMGDPAVQAVDFGSGNGPFERLAAMMGFEEALIAMAMEPEACYDFMSAVVDYKIDVMENVRKYYHADLFTNYDDIATQQCTFMSPDTYRRLIKPLHTRMNEAAKSFGMIPVQHTCGKADALIEDYIETGAAAWTSVQPANDIVGILEKYGDKICLIGGYDTNGRPGQPDASAEEMRAEVHRCLDTYGSHRGYIFFGFRLTSTLDPAEYMQGMAPIFEEFLKCRGQVKVKF